MSRIQFEASWESAGESDGFDVANVSIRVNDQVFTRVFDGEVRDYIRVSAFDLAFWLTENWWRLRYEPYPDKRVPPIEWRLRHELTSISGGTLWPPIMIYGEGTRVVFGPRLGSWKVTNPVRFYNDASVISVDAASYETALDIFSANVVANTRRGTDRDRLDRSVHALASERFDAEVAAWRRLEAQLGFDADEAPEILMYELEAYQRRYGENSVGEAAIAAPGAGAAKAIAHVVQAAQQSTAIVDLGIARHLRSAGARPTSEHEPWRLAETSAAEFRQRVNAAHGPITDSYLSEVLGARPEKSIQATATASALLYSAFLSPANALGSIALQSTPNSQARRFELARALGDAAWVGEQQGTTELFAPISDAKSDRQKFQRSFAQSLLCPFSDLMDFLGTSEPSPKNITDASTYFDVSRRVVETVLVNKEILPRETLEEKLEAA